MEIFLGCENAIHLTIEYDEKEVIPFFMTIFYQLNPTIEIVITPFDEVNVPIEENDSNMFGVRAFIVECSKALITTKLYLFWKLSIPQSMCIYIFAWRQTLEGQFFNVFFLLNIFFGFLGFRLKPKNCSTFLVLW